MGRTCDTPRKFQWLAMFCLNILPLARPAQVAKIQMLTTSSWIVTILLKSILKSLGLYQKKYFIYDSIAILFPYKLCATWQNRTFVNKGCILLKPYLLTVLLLIPFNKLSCPNPSGDWLLFQERKNDEWTDENSPLQGTKRLYWRKIVPKRNGKNSDGTKSK